MNKSRPVVIVFSVLAGLQVLTNATGLSDVADAKWIFLAGILVAAVQTGMTFYVQNQVVPLEDTAAYVNQQGRTVAGPASPPEVLDGASVQVVAPKNEGGYADAVLWIAVAALILAALAIFGVRFG